MAVGKKEFFSLVVLDLTPLYELKQEGRTENVKTQRINDSFQVKGIKVIKTGKLTEKERECNT